MGNRLAIIGAGKFQWRLVETAKNMGYETHVFAWQEGAVCQEIADFFYPISITDYDAITDVCRQIQVQGVVTLGSDLAVLTVNQVAARLHLPHNPLAALPAMTNKFLMRQLMVQAGVPVGPFYV